MAFGLVLGSCSCVCGCTLYRVDPTTGEILWQVSRGTNPSGLGQMDAQLVVYGDHIYTFGTEVADQDDGVIEKWLDEGNRATRVWSSNRDGGPACQFNTIEHPGPGREAIAISPDGSVLWVLGQSGIFSYDAETGLRRGAYTGPSFPPGGTWSDAGGGSVMIPHPTENQVYCSGAGGLGIRLFDADCGVVAQTGSPGVQVEDMCLLPSGEIAVAEYSGFGRYVRLYDADLVAVDNWADLVSFDDWVPPQVGYVLPGRNDIYLHPFSGGLVDNSGKEIVQQADVAAINAEPFGSGFLVRVEQTVIFGLEYPDTVATHPTYGQIPAFGTTVRAVWVALMTPGGTIAESWWEKLDDDHKSYGDAIAQDGSHFYISNAGKMEKRDGSGAVVWSVDDIAKPNGFGWIDIKTGSNFVIVATSGSDLGTTVCVEKSTGAVRWGTEHGFADNSVHVTADDRVYAVGQIAGVSEVDPDA